MTLALTNATVFPATSEESIDNGTVILDGETISWVGPSGDAPVADESVDCTGKTVTPGFVDAHAHLIYDEVTEPYTIELARPLERAAIDAALNARLLLELGFTSIRDVGTRGNIAVTVRDAVADGRLSGPRVKASKQIISVWGGLGDMHPTHIFKREQYAAALTEIVSGPWQARDAVRQHVKDGVDWVKCEASGTGFNPLCPADRDTMSFEELKAICDEAGDKNRPVVCHAESRNSIIKAAKAGVTTIEHAIYLDDEGIQAVLDAGVAICPTLGLYTAFAKKGPEFGIPPEIVAAHNITHEKHAKAIRRAYDAGITLIAGSDSGLSVFPQGGCLEEVSSYVELLGLTTAQALLTMTRDAAAVVGFDDAGTLEVGRRADVVVVDGDPLGDIRALTRDGAIETVIQGGSVVAGSL
ncbi:MAG: amidohydrolase family protein [Gaiellaceae bacterium]